MASAEMSHSIAQSRSNCTDNTFRTEMRIQHSFPGEDSKELAATKTCDTARFSPEWVTNASVANWPATQGSVWPRATAQIF